MRGPFGCAQDKLRKKNEEGFTTKNTKFTKLKLELLCNYDCPLFLSDANVS